MTNQDTYKCDVCDGVGISDSFSCINCEGTGKVDWIV